jgi:hypothetical protein
MGHGLGPKLVERFRTGAHAIGALVWHARVADDATHTEGESGRREIDRRFSAWEARKWIMADICLREDAQLRAIRTQSLLFADFPVLLLRRHKTGRIRRVARCATTGLTALTMQAEDVCKPTRQGNATIGHVVSAWPTPGRGRPITRIGRTVEPQTPGGCCRPRTLILGLTEVPLRSNP